MDDQEKVLMGVACCIDREAGTCNNCPYKNRTNCDVSLWNDFRATLKEREPVEPHVERDCDDETWYYGCGACGLDINPGDKYCRHCGRAVKWDA